MRRILSLILSVLFVIGVFFSVPMTASALNSGIEYIGAYEIEKQINPLYKGLIDESNVITNKPNVYYSDGLAGFDATLYSSDKEVSATAIREGMEDRLATVVVYYKTTKNLTDTELNELFSELQEMAFKETDVATQGDTLRLGHKSFAVYAQGVTDQSEFFYKITFNYEYYTTKAQEDVLTQEIEKLVASFGFNDETSEKTKSDTIYDYITSNVRYDYKNLENESYTLKLTPYAALINKTAVCQGYALLYYRLAKEVGLESRVITGKSLEQNHAWNIVGITNEVTNKLSYYYLDSTWDEGKFRYDYYLKGQNDFYDHENEPQFNDVSFTSKYPIALNGIILSDITGTEGDFSYIAFNNNAYITGYTGKAEKVVVPAKIAGYNVLGLDQGVFFYNNKVKTITFSEGVKYISSESIFGCENLTTINIPSTMNWFIGEEFDEDNFVLSGLSTVPMYCENLTTINLSADNPYMKMVDGILYNEKMTVVIFCPSKYNKTTVTIPEGVKQINDSAFYYCTKIKKIVLPQSLKLIGYWAFDWCENLSICEIPENCLVIGQFAFLNTKITSVNIPSKLEILMPGAFAHCVLTDIDVADDNPYYKKVNGMVCSENAVILSENNMSVTEYTIPEEITKIEDYAFQFSWMKKINLHDNIEYLGHYSFGNCHQLTHFEIPKGVKYLDNDPFVETRSIASIIIPDTVESIAGGLNPYMATIYYETKNGAAYKYAVENNRQTKPISKFVCESGHSFKTVPGSHGMGDVYQCKVCGDIAEMIDEAILATPKVTQKNTSKGISLSWSAIKDAESYIIYRRTYNTSTKKYSGWTVLNKAYTGTSYTDTTVKLGTKYQYTVRAVNGSVQSKYEPTNGLTYNVTPTVKVVLAAKGIKVSWSTAANATGYTVYSSTYNTKTKKWSGWTNRGTVKTTSWTDTKVKSGTQYRYTVRAMNNKVASAYNKTGVATLFLAQPTVKIANNASGVKVAWNKITGAQGYTIYRAEYVNGKWSSWKNMGTIKKNATVSWVDKSAKSGTTYRYTVRAVNGSVKSTYAASNTLLYLAQPKTTVKAVSNGVNVSWTQSTGATGYIVYRSEYNAKTKKWSGWTNMGTTKKTVKSWIDKSAKKGVYYKYTVKAVNGKTASTYKASGSVKR